MSDLGLPSGASVAAGRSYTVHPSPRYDFTTLPVEERQAARPPSPVVHVRRYRRGDWLTQEGVAIKRREIEAKGLPSFQNWRMSTLTLSRELFGNDPLAAYKAGSAKIRKFLYRLRKLGLIKQDEKWCWKLEFQADGWAHWHLFLGRVRKFTLDELDTISRTWAIGRVNTKRIRNGNFDYEFKYAFKPALSDEAFDHDSDCDGIAWAAPQWFLDYVSSKLAKVKGKRLDGTKAFETFEAVKPISFQGVRFWQTSKGFYTGKPRKLQGKSKPPMSCRVPLTVRDYILQRRAAVQVVARKLSGAYFASSVLRLSSSPGSFWDFVGWDTIHGAAVGLACGSFVVPTSTIQKHAHLCTASKLRFLLKSNRLTLRAAELLQRHGETLKTC